MPLLFSRRPSRAWLDRLPLGDGRVGAMVGVTADEARVGLNESSAWSGGVGSAGRERVDPDAAARALAEARSLLSAGDPVAAERALRPLQHRYAQSFLPVGELVVRVLGAAATARAVHRSLDLGTGVHRGRVGGRTSTTIVSAVHGALAHLEESPEPADFEVDLGTPLRHDALRWTAEGAAGVLRLPGDVAPGHEPGEPALTWDVPGVEPGHVAVRVAVRHDGVGEVRASGIVVRRARRLEVVVGIATTVVAMGRAPAPVADAVRRADADVAALLASGDPIGDHAAAFRAGDSGFALELRGVGDAAEATADGIREIDADELVARAGTRATGDPDPALVSFLVAYGVYLLRCSSRAGGVPANLQGIWNDDMRPPWSSDFTLNINTPMNYWGAEATGNPGAHTALLSLLEALAEHGADTAARLYGARGWVAHHNSDVWGYSLPTRGDASWSQWALGGAWLVRQFDEHRRHGSMSSEVRGRHREIARGCARFLLDWIVEVDGEPHTLPSTSPENRFVVGGAAASLTRSSAMDRALIREVLALVADMAAEDGDADDLDDAARAMVARIPPPRTDAEGRIAEWGEERVDEDRHHRHVSHLFAWYPGDSASGLADAVAHTLDTRGDESTGWSLAWKIGLRARLGDGPAVGRLLSLVTRPAGGADAHRGGLYPNLFAAHPPFQIDGNLGLVGAFLEAVVQSHRRGEIELLPALPPGFGAGTVRGLVARPGIVVDLDWSAGRPVHVRLAARHGVGPVATTLRHEGTAVEVTIPAAGAVGIDWPRRGARPQMRAEDRSDRSIT